jgi:glycogen operon protein
VQHGEEAVVEDRRAPLVAARDVPPREVHGEAGGAPGRGDRVLAVLHAGDRPASFVLPGPPWAERYEVVVDTSREEQGEAPGVEHRAGTAITVPARAVLLLRVVG